MSLPPDPLLGESLEAYERRRIRAALSSADRLNEEQADIPLRDLDRDPPKEGESYDTPEMTHDAIARMAASRGKTVRVHPKEPGGPAIDYPNAQRPAPGGLVTRQAPDSSPPPRSVPQIFDANAKAEMGLMVRAVVDELSRGLMQTFADLREDIEANTRLLGVMNAPMEAITDSHERAASSFETLRSDIARGIDTSPAIAQLSKLVDAAGLTEAQSRAEARFEELAAAISASLIETRKQVKDSIDECSKNMLSVLHLLERLQNRELREAKRRAAAVTP